ncbi:MAG: signal peptidase II [Chloroflexota bacterium]|nr:signal peptidase II [Chloroflexota bacterium]
MPFLAVALPIAAVIFVADQLTKSWAQSTLSSAPGNSIEIVDNWLRFSLSHNTGAAFSTLQGQRILYLIIAAVIVVVGYGYYRYLPRDKWLLQVCVGLQLGGAVSNNLVDRIRQGYVVDFIDVGVGNLRWPWFNIADSAIVVGIIILAGYLVLVGEKGTGRG